MVRRGRARPRVLFCIGSLDRGGSETQLVNVVERLHGTRLEARVVLLGRVVDPKLGARLAEAGVQLDVLSPLHGPKPWRMTVSAYGMGARLARWRPHAVYAWLEEAA